MKLMFGKLSRPYWCPLCRKTGRGAGCGHDPEEDWGGKGREAEARSLVVMPSKQECSEASDIRSLFSLFEGGVIISA